MCCAPCATSSVERAIEEGYSPVLYFTNSNIYPEEEYQKRLETAKQFSEIVEIVIKEDIYQHEEWLKVIKGLENEPEKGLRCHKCFEFSLKRTYEKAQSLGIEFFATTLTVSPHKISKIIFEIGKQFPGFIPLDFKKKDGYKRSIELSKEYELYRQNYCGCEFSIR